MTYRRTGDILELLVNDRVLHSTRVENDDEASARARLAEDFAAQTRREALLKDAVLKDKDG